MIRKLKKLLFIEIGKGQMILNGKRCGNLKLNNVDIIFVYSRKGMIFSIVKYESFQFFFRFVVYIMINDCCYFWLWIINFW